MNHLHGHRSIERQIRREEYHPHTSAPQLPLHAVLASKRSFERGAKVVAWVRHRSGLT
jgi:hypothetical protein